MWKWTKRALVTLVILVCIITVITIWILKYQGSGNVEWHNLTWGKVTFDAKGIPTLTADTWNDLTRLQGYVHASDRLWQMDLIRRASGGRLSELFGPPALKHDRMRVEEDWQGAAKRGYDNLPADEKEQCEAYAAGVNQFIKENERHWGLEYTILNVKPEQWTCTDSLLVLLHMSQTLSGSSDMEFRQAQWRENLTDEWQNFLFPKSHPWAKPIFGNAPRSPTPPPPSWQFIPKSDFIETRDLLDAELQDPEAKGSNAWVVSQNGKTFLASDPHLGHHIPQTWYANSLRINNDEWVTGASLPGLPGVVIGLNPHIAWSFTNVGEDVDDLLKETLSPDGNQYLASNQNGRPVWLRLIKKREVIKVRGQQDQIVEIKLTHRGPLKMIEHKGHREYYSRQWLALRSGILRLAAPALNKAKNWQDFNKALDRMLTPPQAAIYADRQHNIGLRITGVGIKRPPVTGLAPQPATKGEWLGLESVNQRQRRLLTPNNKKPDERRTIINANAQLWADNYGHRWTSDDRRERIERALDKMADLTQEKMEELQLDTQSRFAQMLLQWIDHHAGQSTELIKIRERWRRWNGAAASDKQTFAEATYLEQVLVKILLGRVRDQFFAGQQSLPEYESYQRRAWLLRVLLSKAGTLIFGYDNAKIAETLLNQLRRKLMQANNQNLIDYSVVNSWDVQHPFVKALPMLGWLFKVKTFPQVGGQFLVRAERPDFGPSMRLVINLHDISQSSWLFPVGQSGHVGSPHYRDQQDLWISNKQRLAIFTEP